MKIRKKISAVPVEWGGTFCVTVPVSAVPFPAPVPVVPSLKSYVLLHGDAKFAAVAPKLHGEAAKLA